MKFHVLIVILILFPLNHYGQKSSINDLLKKLSKPYNSKTKVKSVKIFLYAVDKKGNVSNRNKLVREEFYDRMGNLTKAINTEGRRREIDYDIYYDQTGNLTGISEKHKKMTIQYEYGEQGILKNKKF